MDILEKAMKKVEIHRADSVKGALYLPEEVTAHGETVRITWESDRPEVVNPAASGVNGEIAPGFVTRPDEDVRVKLTATFHYCPAELSLKNNSESTEKTPGHKERVSETSEGTFGNRAGKITVKAPVDENNGTTEGVSINENCDILTNVSAKANEKTAQKTFEVLVKKKPEEKVYGGYVYTYFHGAKKKKEKEVQQVHLAASDDGLHWQELNKGKPVLVSNLGTGGARDTVIFRSHEGDRFYILATDLDANGGDWATYGNEGSPYIIIWESDDLVNWSAPRMVKIGFPDSACTWAPRAFYEEATGQYVVYWSSEKLPSDWKAFMAEMHRKEKLSDPGKKKKKHKKRKPSEEELRMFREMRPGKQIYYAKTRDFIHFTEARLYKGVRPNKPPYNDDLRLKHFDGPWLSYIDTTVYKYHDTVYRFTKREQDITIFLETANDWFGEFTTKRQVIAGETGVEGPDIFKLNGREQWILMMDGYCRKNKRVGYFPLIAEGEEALKSGDFRRLAPDEYEMPPGAKHGAIIPVTKEELEAVRGKWK
ncbi:MAG: glycoside hydrolase family 43 protein [Lachnospiraceae bacterium]|nr:glycoside hydrolase family 43 protein [Lachnospiraceae bacterium]